MVNNYLIPLNPNETYHVFNRAIGNEKLFLSKNNYSYFLDRFEEYILPVADTYCYCLLPNHFHFLIRIKDHENLTALYRNAKIKDVKDLSGLISQQFSNLFNSYTKGFNKMYNRKGALLMRPFKRSLIQGDDYFIKIVHYIHANPVHHGLCKQISDWEFSSYKSLINTLPTWLLRKEVLERFGN